MQKALVPTIIFLAGLALGWFMRPSPVPAKGNAPRQTKRAPTELEREVMGKLVVGEGVFSPAEARIHILPFMAEHAEYFRGKSVLEIGTGSGAVSVFAAKLGAKKVVSTDISEAAVKCASENAARFGFAETIDVRLVPPDDMSAYSVIGPKEAFDIIISNPPYALDFEAEGNTPAIDRGDLGFSIVRGFKDHLADGGISMLFYRTAFYHHVMIEFARKHGYEVKNHNPDILAPWELNIIFSFYLRRFLEIQGLAPDFIKLKKNGFMAEIVTKRQPPMLGNVERIFPGWMVITRQS